jgi:hypothetical protein
MPDCTTEEAAFYAAASVAYSLQQQWVAADAAAQVAYNTWQECLQKSARQEVKGVPANPPNHPRKKCNNCKRGPLTKTKGKTKTNKRRRTVAR